MPNFDLNIEEANKILKVKLQHVKYRHIKHVQPLEYDFLIIYMYFTSCSPMLYTYVRVNKHMKLTL